MKPEAHTDVVLFQCECVQVLADHFARKRQPTLPSPQTVVLADPQIAGHVAQIAEQIDMLSGVVNLMREHLAALLAVPGQVAGLSEQMSQAVTMLELLAERQDVAETQIAQIDALTQRLTPPHTRDVQVMVERMVRETKRLQQPLTYAIMRR